MRGFAIHGPLTAYPPLNLVLMRYEQANEGVTDMSEWQPIETAPKDVPILVTDGKHIVVIKRGILIGNVPWPDPVGFAGYDWEWNFEYADLTHWMPLPEPPKP